MPLANLWLIRLRGQFPILRTKSCSDFYPLIRPPKRPLALGRGSILIPGFVRSPPTLAVYYVFHSLPRGGVGRVFLFTEDETRRHFSYLSGTFRETSLSQRKIKCLINMHDIWSQDLIYILSLKAREARSLPGNRLHYNKIPLWKCIDANHIQHDLTSDLQGMDCTYLKANKITALNYSNHWFLTIECTQ